MNLTNTQINAIVDTIVKNKKEKREKELVSLFEQLKPQIEADIAAHNLMVERENEIKQERRRKVEAINNLLSPFKYTLGTSHFQNALSLSVDRINIMANVNKPISEAERLEIKRKVILATITVNSVDELIEKLSNE